MEAPLCDASDIDTVLTVSRQRRVELTESVTEEWGPSTGAHTNKTLSQSTILEGNAVWSREVPT